MNDNELLSLMTKILNDYLDPLQAEVDELKRYLFEERVKPPSEPSDLAKVAVQLQSCHRALRALVSANMTGDPREVATALAHAKEWLGSRP